MRPTQVDSGKYHESGRKSTKTISLRVSTLMLYLQLLMYFSPFCVDRIGLRYTAVFTIVHMCRAHFTAVLPKKWPLKHQKPIVYVFQHICCLWPCAPTFPWILFVFVVHRGGLQYIGLGAYRSPPVSAAFYRSPPRKWPLKHQTLVQNITQLT